MNEVTQELDIIAHIRSEVTGRKVPTGENLFLAWGYPTAFFLLLEFAALMLWHENWCEWLWAGIPLVGAPLMMYFLKKDYERTGRRTPEQSVILQMWICVGFVSCIGGATMGFAGVFEIVYCTFQGLLIGIGCFMTGLILRYQPKIVCGLVAIVLSFLSLFFQGELWHWQLLVAAIVTIVALIIPGHLFHQYVKNYEF